jgi:hypothetical protein
MKTGNLLYLEFSYLYNRLTGNGVFLTQPPSRANGAYK